MKPIHDFAELYLEGRVIEPSWVFSYSNLLIKNPDKNYKKEKIAELMSKSELPSVNNLNLAQALKAKLYISLYELTLAMVIARFPLLKEQNKYIIRKRRSAIIHLKKALEYQNMSQRCKSAMEAEIERLEKYDEQKMAYHPLKEVEFFETSLTIGKLEKLISEIPPPIVTGNTADIIADRYRRYLARELEFERIRGEIESLIQEKTEKWNAMVARPMSNIKEGRPTHFFFKVLQVVIFRRLHDGGEIPKEKSKELAADIINGYFKKDPTGFFCKAKNFKRPTIKPKDIDNALHSS